jgi:orotate phosphoribosyltransferase
LLDVLVRRSYQRADEPRFQLTSGKMSSYYVDCKATTLFGPAIPLLGQELARHLPARVDAVGGRTFGADPLAYAIAAHRAAQGRPVNVFSVRKEPKKHGLRKWIEGCAESGARVVVLDDVVTTGKSTIEAIRRCRDEGLVVVGVLVLVDRQEEGGREAIEAEAGPDVPVRAVFTRADLDTHTASTHRRRRAPRGRSDAVG